MEEKSKWIAGQVRRLGQCTAAKTADFAKKCRPVSRYVNIVILTIIFIIVTDS